MRAELITWNIRTLLETGKIEEISREMERYKISILALQEIRWGGAGRGQHGSAFMIDKKIKNKLIQFKKIDGRISYLRIKSAIANISFINAYAPTE
ncbi:hypothetical protein RN001_012367 [Aquatica leii]|uniref:Endonuclease/exonuclease/phosphatase domain-containing protein n=1 Tax=Aquatica leii TaxID=1421715 RepID=A0AAN7Q1J2_9COLE|nr:hypothetical protein RN001_012367 [Aquatica leii]